MATLSRRCSGGDVWLRQPRLRVPASPSSGLGHCHKEKLDTIAQVRWCSLDASRLEAIPRCPVLEHPWLCVSLAHAQTTLSRLVSNVALVLQASD